MILPVKFSVLFPLSLKLLLYLSFIAIQSKLQLLISYVKPSDFIFRSFSSILELHLLVSTLLSKDSALPFSLGCDPGQVGFQVLECFALLVVLSFGGLLVLCDACDLVLRISD